MNGREGPLALLFLLFALAIASSLVAGCGEAELKSSWPKDQVMIDGKNTEWHDSLANLADEHLTIGLLNDSTYLYIGIITTDRILQRQIMTQGLTFWFDREGGKEHTFGVHYPLGRGGFTRGSEAPAPEQDRESPREGFETASSEVELLGPHDADHERMTLAQTGGIDARFQISNGILVYEMKVPLNDNGNHPFAIGTKPGALIGVGLETTPRSTRSGPELGTGSDEGTGVGGSGGGARGGRGGAGRRGRGAGGESSRMGGQTEPMKMWAKVTLAERNLSPR